MISVTIPKNGNTKMYTSGCPKNQKRCCQRIGEPPVCNGKFGFEPESTPLTYRPLGIKKLVPAMRSSSNRMPPPSSTGNDNNASTAVVNHAQQVSGMRINDMPFVRMFSNVVMKFNAPSSEPTQKIAMLMTQRFMPAPCPGPAIFPTALNGAYAVHPPIGPTVPLPPANDGPRFANHSPKA